MTREKSVSEGTRARQQATYGRVLLTGATGFVGGYALDALRRAGEVVTVGRRRCAGSSLHLEGDLHDEALLAELERLAPRAVVHLAALTDPDRCEREDALARAVNEEMPGRLARRLSRSCRRFVYASTDLVFDGEAAPYAESAPPRPLSAYGGSKLAGERAVREALGERATVVRLALLYGERRTAQARPSFAESLVRRVGENEPVDLFTDQYRSPLYAEDAGRALARLLEMEAPPPLLHLGGPERWSRFDMGVAALELFGLSAALARPCPMPERPSAAKRPRDVSLDVSLATGLGLEARPLRAGLEAMKRAMGRTRS